MPFILFPRISQSIFKIFLSKESKKIHRYHNDGIEINHNSPECFDEIFWIKTKINFNSQNTNYIINFLNAYNYLISRYSDLAEKIKPCL